MQIRLWKMGSLEHGVIPTKDALNKLSDMLKGFPDYGTVDLVWGPDLACEVIETEDYPIDIVVKVGFDEEEFRKKFNSAIEKEIRQNINKLVNKLIADLYKDN